MWFGMIRCKCFFNQRQKLHHGIRFLFESKMNGNAGLLVTGAEPQIIGCNSADLGYEKVRADRSTHFLDSEDGIRGIPVRHKIFSLQFFTAAGVKPILKCGNLSYHLPGTPICSVQFSAGSSIIGCTFLAVGFAPKKSCFIVLLAISSIRLLIHTSLIEPPFQSVNKLTL